MQQLVSWIHEDNKNKRMQNKQNYTENRSYYSEGQRMVDFNFVNYTSQNNNAHNYGQQNQQTQSSQQPNYIYTSLEY